MWMKSIQQDLKSNNLSLNEAIVMAQNHPLWRLMSTFGECTPSGARQKLINEYLYRVSKKTSKIILL